MVGNRRNGWSDYTGISGRLTPESVVGLHRNTHLTTLGVSFCFFSFLRCILSLSLASLFVMVLAHLYLMEVIRDYVITPLSKLVDSNHAKILPMDKTFLDSYITF